jgi:shikimate 5-dehydrogenase
MDSVKEFAKKSHIIVDAIPVRHLKLSSFNFRGKVVLEARYNNSTLKRSVIRDGGEYISGISWLLHQAIPSFRIFTGEEPNIHAMEILASEW